MAKGDPRFPLLRLSEDAILRVLKSMEVFELILFSFSTKKSRSLVECINLKIRSGTYVDILDGITVCAVLPNLSYPQWTFYRNEFQNRQPNQAPIKIAVPENITFSCDQQTYVFREMSLTLKEWIAHIKRILHSPIIDTLSFANDEGLFDVGSIANAVGEVRDVAFISPGTEEQHMEKLKLFLLNRGIFFDNNVWQEKKRTANVLIQNYDSFSLSVSIFGDTLSNIALDDLLLMNCKWNYVERAKFTSGDMNRFLKLWTRRRGCRLEHIIVHSQDRLDKAAVFKGIPYQKLDPDRERQFKASTDNQHIWSSAGEYEIKRRDGTRATIYIGNSCLEMYVWHDYCIVEE